MQLPTFDGTEAIAWLARAEQFFLDFNIPTEARLPLAMAALAEPALPWIHLLKLRIPVLTWDRFTQELLLRFGDTATPYLARQLNSWPAVSTASADKKEVQRIPTDEDRSKFTTGDKQVLEEFEKKEVVSPHELAAFPPRSAMYYEINLLSFAKENGCWDMSTKEKIEVVGTKHEEGHGVFKAGKYATASKRYEKAVKFIEREGTLVFRFENCQRSRLLRTHLSCWHVGTIAIWSRATGSRSTRYWFSGRGMRWKNLRGWMWPIYVMCFDFYLSLEGKAVSTGGVVDTDEEKVRIRESG